MILTRKEYFMKLLKIVLTILALSTVVLSQAPTNSWTGTKEISKVEFNELENKVIAYDLSGNTYTYWYDCTYYQCFQGANTKEDSKKIIAFLLEAKSSGNKVDFYGYQNGSGFWFNSLRVGE